MVSSTETVKNIETEGKAQLPSPQPARARSLKSLLARGGATLGGAVVLDRGFGFLANLLAARAAGPQSFGAYSVVLATAGTVANYAGAGIGSSANRFSGQYPVGSKGYGRFLRAIILVSVVSAVLATALMLVGAGPFARLLLRNEALVQVLRVAAFSAGALILLECTRGLLIGQHKFRALLLLSTVFGAGMLLVLPSAARVGAGAMIMGHAGVALLAVAICVLLSRRLGIVPRAKATVEEGVGPGGRSIIAFGFVQLGAVVGINIASWWLASLVARADASLLQMGMYAVANQFRGLASILPGLLGQVTYPLLTDESGSHYGGPDRVVLVNTFLATSLTVVFAGAALIFLPWILPQLYGQVYAGAEGPSAFLLATAVSHMGGTAAANRVSIVNLRALGVINAVWAALIIVLGVWLIPLAGATGAAAAFFVSHLFSQVAVLIVLSRAKALPRGLLRLSLLGMSAATAFAALAYVRAKQPIYEGYMTIALACSLLMFSFAFLHFGLRQGWVPKMKRKGA